MNKTAFLFPGQGSQKVGMGKTFEKNPLCQKLFDIANESLGYDLQKLCWKGPELELTLSKNAQPAILTVSTIAHSIFMEKNSIIPSYIAGHSLGEYSGLVAAEVVDFSDAVFAVHKRGELMQAAVPEGVGAMAAILGKKDEEVIELCSQISSKESIVTPANFNCPGQVVISGHKQAVEIFLQQARGIMLQVSAPFHCPLMYPVKEKFAKVLSQIEFKTAKYPIVNNIKAEIQTEEQSFRDSLLQQIDNPVLWNKSIQTMIQNGVVQFLEYGEGRVLTGLLKKINKDVTYSNINSLETLELDL